jgi:hypothetical protein
MAVRYVEETGQVLSYAPAVHTPDYEDRPGYLMITRPGKDPDLSILKGVPVSRWIVRAGSLEIRNADAVPPSPVASPGAEVVPASASLSLPTPLREAGLGLGRPLVEALERFKRAPPALPIDALLAGFLGSIGPMLSDSGEVKVGIFAGLLTVGSAAIRAIKERNVAAMLDSMSASLWEALGKLNVRLEDMETRLKPEAVRDLLESAIKAGSADALEAAKRAFRNLALRGDTAEGQEVTRHIASLEPLQLLALRDVGYWNTPPYPRPVQPLARSIEIADEIAESVCRALEAKGLLEPGLGSGTYLLTGLGRTLIAVLEEPIPPAPAP